MNREESISPFQFGAIKICFLLGTILHSTYISHVTGSESWMIAFTGAIAFLPFLLLYLWLSRRFPGMDLFEITEAVFGAGLGRIISILYLSFFGTMAVSNLISIGVFTTGFYIQGTPTLIITLTIALAATYVLRKGIEPLARLMPMIVILTFGVVLINFLQALPNANFNHMLPMFQRTPLEYLQSTHIAVAIPYGESLLMLVLLPNVRKGTDIKKPLLVSLAATVFIMVLVHVREVISLGSLLTYITFPSYEITRMMDVNAVFARTESLYGMAIMSVSFFKVCIVLYGVARGIAQITRVKDYRPFTLPVAIYLAIYTIAFQYSPYNNIEWNIRVTPIIWSTFECLLPAGTALWAILQSLIRRRKAAYP